MFLPPSLEVLMRVDIPEVLRVIASCACALRRGVVFDGLHGSVERITAHDLRVAR